MRLLSLALSAVAFALVAGCAQVPARVAPSVPATPYVPAQPVAFSALLLSLEGCPSGQVLFAVPWAHSSAYRADIVFVRAPDPVPTCVELVPSMARAYLGRNLLLEKVGERYRLHSATSALPAASSSAPAAPSATAHTASKH